jgi:hypothetical protein
MIHRSPLVFTPITRADLDTCSRFHAGDCTVTYGKTGRARPGVRSEEWRANGALQTWKRDPYRFRLPLKHGMRDYSALDGLNDAWFDTPHYGGRPPVYWYWHRADTCPALAEAAAWWDARNAAGVA